SVFDPSIASKKRLGPSDQLLNETGLIQLRANRGHPDHAADAGAVETRSRPADHLDEPDRGSIDVVENGDAFGVGDRDAVHISLVAGAVEIGAIAVAPNSDPLAARHGPTFHAHSGNQIEALREEQPIGALHLLPCYRSFRLWFGQQPLPDCCSLAVHLDVLYSADGAT